MFITTDGYRLKREQRADGTYYWTDGDLIFEDEKSWPVDSNGERLSGRRWRSGEVPEPIQND